MNKYAEADAKSHSLYDNEQEFLTPTHALITMKYDVTPAELQSLEQGVRVKSKKASQAAALKRVIE